MKRKLDILLMVMFLFGSMIFLCPIFGQIKEVEEDEGQSRILCKVQNVVQIEHNLCKTVAAQAAAALFIK